MKDYLISPGLQNALVYSSNDTMKTMSNVDKVNFKDVLHTTEYYNCKPKKGKLSGREKYPREKPGNESLKKLIK